MAKTIELNCSAPLTDIVLVALRNYVDMSYPAGSSDCALVARESLLDTVHALEEQRRAGAACHYNRHLRAMLKEAVKLHYRVQAHDQGHDCSRQCAVLLDACQGLPRTEAELQAARELDAA
jgi:hypothetical protein